MKNLFNLFILLFVLTNAYAQWKPVNNGINFASISALEMFDNCSFLADVNSGVYYSGNYGESWILSSNGFPKDEVKCFAKMNSKVFAGTKTNGIYVSDNKGSYWYSCNDGINDIFINTIAANDNNIFAGSNAGTGVYFSSDSGRTWATRNTGLMNTFIKKLILDSDTIYASTENGLYRSDNLGKNWYQLGPEVATGPTVLFYINKNRMIIVNNNNLLISNDYGKNWVNKGIIEYNVHIQNISIFDDELFASTDKGIFLSKNWGESWTEVFSEMLLNSEKILTIYKNHFLLYSNNMLFRSVDSGTNWQIATLGLQSGVITFLHFAKEQAYVSTELYGFHYSDDNCKTWKKNQVLTIPINGEVISVNNDGDNIYATLFSQGIYLSTDKGQTWKERNNGLPYFSSVTNLTVENHIIYGIVTKEHTTYGVYMSADSGNTWKWLRNGLPENNIEIRSFVVNNGEIIMISNYGIFKYSNQTNQWSNKVNTDPFKTESKLKTMTKHNGIIYAIGWTGNDTIYWSEDNGETWQHISTGLGYRYFTSIVVTDKFLIVGCGQNGIWFSNRNENNWIPANKGLPSLRINQLVVHDNAIYACTGNGLYTIDDIDKFDILTDVPINPLKDNKLSIFPNPVQQNTSISLKGFEDCNFITMFDMMGKVIYKETYRYNYSNNLITIDLSKLNINPGTYFVVSDNGKSAKFVVTE